MYSRNKYLFLVTLYFMFLQAWGKTPSSYNFVITRARYSRLCSSKNIITVNGEFPGPTIYAHKGDTVTVNVYNKVDENITLHWHGITEPRNPWSDGPNYITQCPIQPGASFKYNIITGNEEGTLWWHAHSDWTRATVHGVIIIYPKRGTTYPFPKPYQEIPIILGSWWKKDVNRVLRDALQYGGEPNISNAHTINGQPGDLLPCSKQGTFRSTVKQGKTYLLRIVNAGMNSEHFLAVAEHQLTVVGRDGSYVKPLLTDYIMITPGQSMDVLLKANKSPGQYYMAARPYASASADRVSFDNSTATAVIQYKSGDIKHNQPPLFPKLPAYNDTPAATDFVIRFRSLANKEHPITIPLTVDTKMEITISVNTLPCPNRSCEAPNGTRFSASMNNISFASPSIDILSAYYGMINGVFKGDFPNKPPFIFNFTADSFPSNLFTPKVGTKVKVLEYNSSVEIVFQGTNLLAGENHPIHIHGYSYYVVGFGFGNFDPKKDPLTYNLVDPPKFNTIGVPKNGWAAIRFRANNPGVWFMHCHLERHLSWGMDAAFIVKNGVKPENRMLPPPHYRPPC
ncbi:hypothetical protein ACHQM5_004681 [Ranunculus cassubicifolius]